MKSNCATPSPFGSVSCFVVEVCLSNYNLNSFVIHQAPYSKGYQWSLMHREVLGSIWKIGRYPIKVSEVLEEGEGGAQAPQWKITKIYSFLKNTDRGPLRGGRGGGTGSSCSPEINWLVPLFIKNLFFLCSMQFPNIVFLPLKIWPLICNPEINASFPSAIFHCSQKSQTEPQYWLGPPSPPRKSQSFRLVSFLRNIGMGSHPGKSQRYKFSDPFCKIRLLMTKKQQQCLTFSNCISWTYWSPWQKLLDPHMKIWHHVMYEQNKFKNWMRACSLSLHTVYIDWYTYR